MYSTTPWVSSGPGPAAGLFRPDRGSAFAGGWGGSARHTHRCRPGTCPRGIHTSLAAIAPAQPTTPVVALGLVPRAHFAVRSEEHTSELQSLMRTSYAVFCLKKKNNYLHTIIRTTSTH